jgi:predicted transcriptional regulator
MAIDQNKVLSARRLAISATVDAQHADTLKELAHAVQELCRAVHMLTAAIEE